jgi:cytidylate kinase
MYAVAIDGPSGAGKSTLAKRLAKHFNWVYVDTGAVYRAVGLACERQNLSAANAPAILPSITVELDYAPDGTQQTLLNDENVSAEIRRDVISKYASDVSALPEVRAFLLELQRGMAKTRSVVMDGRDIGTVVLPNATVKIFLTAKPEVRAERRRLELEQRGEHKAFSDVLASIEQRDHNDSKRENAPLRQAEGAVLIDSTLLTEDEAFDKLLNVVNGVVNAKIS